LPNGVTLLVQRRTAAPAAALVTHVRAGFLDEPDEVQGISHVLEHMLFKGTPTLGPGELAQRTKALGGSLNAYTSYDRTVYYASVPARHAIEAMTLQADQVRNPLFDAEELRKELGVIIQEAKRKLDTPGAVTGETLHELLYDQHRIRRWRIGHEAVLEGFTRDQVAEYHRSRYIPARTIVAVVGDVDPATTLAALTATWGDWSLPEQPIAEGPAEHSAPELRAKRMHGDVAMVDLSLGWRGVGPLDPREATLDVAAAILTGGRGARLSRLLREPGLVAGIGAGHYGTTDADGGTPAGVFAIGAELEPSRVPEVLGVVAATLRDLRDHGPSPDELTRAQTMLQARIERRLERYEARATALADAEASGRPEHIDHEVEEILGVTAAQVQRAVAESLDPAQAAAVGYFPSTSDAPFDTDVVHRAMQARAFPMPSLAIPTAPVRASHPLRTAIRRTSHGVLHVALPGLDLLLAQHGEVPQVSLSIYRPRPAVTDPALAGLEALGMRTLVRGTARLEAAQLAVALEAMGGVLSPSLGADVIGLGTTVLAEHVVEAARLLREVMETPRLDPGSVQIERDLLLDDARSVADDMMRFPFQLALGQAFGDVGYGAPAFGTPESLASFDLASVRRWHAGFAQSGPTTVVAVSAMEPARLADLLLEPLAEIGDAWSRRRVTADAVERPRAGARTAHRDRQQSALAMLFPGPSRREAERHAAEVWGAIAGGLGGRLFESLRSQRSLAYTVMASSWQRQRAGGLLTYIAMAPERLDEARDAMLEELARFRETPPTEVEVQRATAMLSGQAEVARQSAGSVAGEIADAWLLGEGLIELDDPGAPYRRVTAEEVHAVSASFDPTLRAEGVVSPERSE
jgi:zinc protease